MLIQSSFFAFDEPQHIFCWDSHFLHSLWPALEAKIPPVFLAQRTTSPSSALALIGCILGEKKLLFSKRVVRHWNRLPREVESPYLGVLNNYGDGALRDVVNGRSVDGLGLDLVIDLGGVPPQNAHPWKAWRLQPTGSSHGVCMQPWLWGHPRVDVALRDTVWWGWVGVGLGDLAGLFQPVIL